jgi:hypothetical protein
MGLGSGSGSGSGLGLTSGNATQGDDMASSPNFISGSEPPIHPPVAVASLMRSWPAETNLLLLPVSNKVMLTVQRPLMHAVFQEAFERICATLLFRDAFPDVYGMLEMVRDGLVTAAESNDHAMNIYHRLLCDSYYANNMGHLVSCCLWNII